LLGFWQAARLLAVEEYEQEWCIFWPEGTDEGACEGPVREEWVDDGEGGVQPTLYCRKHNPQAIEDLVHGLETT